MGAYRLILCRDCFCITVLYNDALLTKGKRYGVGVVFLSTAALVLCC